jgi:hypothetical protein
MANGWQQAPPPTWQAAPPQQSGLLKAGTILLLVGAILSAVGGGLTLLMALFMGAVFGALSSEVDGGMWAGGLIAGFYGIFALLLIAGSVCGFVAWRRAGRGDLQGAFVWGLVASLLPPLNVLLLLGAIFAKVCPEAEAAAARQRQGWPPPPQAR